jgi:hypothetical protein
MKQEPLYASLILLFSLVGALMVAGCGRGYARASDLERLERGPTACASSCEELGLEMGAFVLMDRGQASCVCTPPSSAAEAEGATSSTAGSDAAALQEQRAAAQRDAAQRAEVAALEAREAREEMRRQMEQAAEEALERERREQQR